MKATLFHFGLLLTAGLLVTSCVPPVPNQVQKPVTITVEAPPSPPGPGELEKPPNVELEKPTRDPFMSLVAPGGSSSTDKGTGGSTGGSYGAYNVTGILVAGKKSSAILESGTSSFIVHPGDKVGGYFVSAITPKQVILVRGKEKLTLTFFGGK